MKKVFLFLFVSCFLCMSIFGDEIPLQPRQSNDPPSMGSPKAPNVNNVEALLEGNTLTLFFSPSTSSEVIITDSQTNTVVYSNSFGVATGQVINLSTLPAGEYELSIFAFGQWWEGEFVVEETESE